MREEGLEIINFVHASDKQPIAEIDLGNYWSNEDFQRKDDMRKRHNEACRAYRLRKRKEINYMQEKLKGLKDKNNQLQHEASSVEMQVETMKKLVYTMFGRKN